MDYPGRAAVGVSNVPLVLLSFLQQNTPSCVNVDFTHELDTLNRELSLSRCNSNPITSNGHSRNDHRHHEDGELQTDGHFPCIITGPPGVQLGWPDVNFEEAEARMIAAELRDIADQLEHDVVLQATNNLARRLLNSPVNQWKNYLTLEVEWVVKRGLELHLQQLPQERIIVALTLTLVKGVCSQTPWLLRSLFNTAVQYISAAVDRR